MTKNYVSKLILMTVLICGMHFGVTAQCNCAWQYRMPFTITNSSPGPMADVQVPVIINTSALVGAGKMLASGNDIRFTDVACTNLPYWIESGMNTTTTKIWVRVNTISTIVLTTIYMYYGNTAAAAASSGNATFIFFDDFSGTSIDATMWDTSYTAGSVTVSGGSAAFTSSSGHMQLFSINSYPAPYYSEMNVTAATGEYPNIGQGDTGHYSSNAGAAMFAIMPSTMYLSNTHTSAGLTGYSGGFTLPTTLGSVAGIWSFVRDEASGNTFGIWPGGSISATTVDVIPAVGMQSTSIGLLKSGTGTMTVDWVRGRKYYPDTTVQTPGAEQVNGPAPVTGSVLVCPGHTANVSDATTGGTWGSGNTSVATVNTGGTVTGASGGTASISYTIASGCAATTVATVYPTPAPSIIVSGNTLSSSASFSTYQWSIGGTPIGGATDASYTFTLTGFYTLTVTDVNGCTGTSPAATINVGVKNVSSTGSDITVYPNPAQREVYITSPGGISAVSISNVVGQNVFSAQYATNTAVVNIAQLPDGVYFVRVNNTNVYRVVKGQ